MNARILVVDDNLLNLELAADVLELDGFDVRTAASAMKGDAERLLASGFSAYLSKPIDPATFGAAVQSLLDRSRSGSGE